MIRHGRVTVTIGGHVVGANPNYYPGLGICRTGKVTWHLVHLPSQKALSRPFHAHADAEQAAIRLSAVVCWAQPLDDISAAVEHNRLLWPELTDVLGPLDPPRMFKDIPARKRLGPRKRRILA